MAILVDEPQWPWRGRRWAHLVSDQSHDELHEFARRLGKRRLGFQGDHYDVDEIDHTRALALGAEAVGARDLVRRLRAAGLRRRGSKPEWVEVGRWAPGVAAAGMAAVLPAREPGVTRIVRAVDAHRDLDVRATVAAFIDPDHLVALFELPAGAAAPAVALDVDLHWVGGPRADETSSIEVFVRR